MRNQGNRRDRKTRAGCGCRWSAPPPKMRASGGVTRYDPQSRRNPRSAFLNATQGGACMEDPSRVEEAGAGLGGSAVVERAAIDRGPGSGSGPRTRGGPASAEGEALPAGRQFELRRGGVRAGVTEVGATLRVLEVGGLSVLRGFPVDGIPDASRGQVLIPFPNRIDRGRYAFHGRSLELPLDEPDRTNAMHGLVRWL